MREKYKEIVGKLLKENEKLIINGRRLTFPSLDPTDPVPVGYLRKQFPGFIFSVYRGNITITPSGGLTPDFFFEEISKDIQKNQQQIMVGKWSHYKFSSGQILKRTEEKNGLSSALEGKFHGFVFYVGARSIAYKLIPHQEPEDG